MYSKLAIKNVRKSLKDYFVYFLTLTLGVCLFYIFNSVGEQTVMMDISEASKSAIEAMTILMKIVSVFVAVILAFLVLYANGFIIKRRKKELGVYTLLGMEKRRISGILMIETAIVGIISLAVGIVVGILASQGLSVITAKLFNAHISSFRFVFSPGACLGTVICFAVMFVIVMIFNSASISKTKLIDLLYGDKKTQNMKIRKKGTCVALMILGALFMAAGYYVAIKSGINIFGFVLILALALVGVGSLFFFMSVSGFVQAGIKKNPKKYYKGLNIFSFRQIFSKINTNYASLTIICLLLFMTIAVFSSAASFNAAMGEQGEDNAPYDAGVTLFAPETDMEAQMREMGFDTDKYFEDYTTYYHYETGVPFNEVIAKYGNESKYTDEVTFVCVKESDYKKLMQMQGVEPIDLGENGYLIFAPATLTLESLRPYLDDPCEIEINGFALEPKGVVGDKYLYDSYGSFYDIEIVVPDKAAEGLISESECLVANYNGDKFETEEALQKGFFPALNERTQEIYDKETIHITQIETINMTQGYKTSVAFVGIYMGAVFLIAAAAVLALQQLSETADSKKRYELLKKLGCSAKMINSSLLKQTAVYFLMPLALAAVHSVFGIYVIVTNIMNLGNVNIVSSTIITALFVAGIYGVYFIATYMGGKNILKAQG